MSLHHDFTHAQAAYRLERAEHHRLVSEARQADRERRYDSAETVRMPVARLRILRLFMQRG